MISVEKELKKNLGSMANASGAENDKKGIGGIDKKYIFIAGGVIVLAVGAYFLFIKGKGANDIPVTAQ